MSIHSLEALSSSINQGNKLQISQALQIQTYCQAVRIQPYVSFSRNTELKELGQKINTKLQKAKLNADTYLDIIQPNIITNISNICNFYSLQNVIPITLAETATEQDWLEVLIRLKNMVDTYQTQAVATAKSLSELNKKLTNDAMEMSATVSDLKKIEGSNSNTFKDLEKELKDIESQIQGTIAGIVVSGLGIVGGVFITAVGSIANFVTVGTSTPVAIAGGIIAVGGVSGCIAKSLELKRLYNCKTQIITKKELSAEIQLALGIKTGFETLDQQVKEAITATQAMVNSWELLSGAIENMSKNLQDGINSTGAVRTWLLEGANAMQKTTLMNEIEIIKKQITGVKVIEYQNDRDMNTTIDKLLEEARRVPLII